MEDFLTTETGDGFGSKFARKSELVREKQGGRGNVRSGPFRASVTTSLSVTELIPGVHFAQNEFEVREEMI